MDIVKFLRDSRAVPVIAVPFIVALSVVASVLPLTDTIQFFTLCFPASLLFMLPALICKLPDSKKVNLDTILISLVVLVECAIIRSHL